MKKVASRLQTVFLVFGTAISCSCCGSTGTPCSQSSASENIAMSSPQATCPPHRKLSTFQAPILPHDELSFKYPAEWLKFTFSEPELADVIVVLSPHKFLDPCAGAKTTACLNGHFLDLVPNEILVEWVQTDNPAVAFPLPQPNTAEDGRTASGLVYHYWFQPADPACVINRGQERLLAAVFYGPNGLEKLAVRACYPGPDLGGSERTLLDMLQSTQITQLR